MYADVIPAIRLPKNLNVFTYKLPSNLEGDVKIGQVVVIPWRNLKIHGVVKAIYPDNKIPAIKNIKAINAIVAPNLALSIEQINLAIWLSEYYQVSLGIIIKTILPPVPVRTSAARQTIVWTDFTATKIKLPKYTKGLPNLIEYATVKYLYDLLFNLIVATKNQTLVLVPEIADLAIAGNYLNKKFKKTTVVYHGQLNKNQEFETWKSISMGEAKIILGTRQAVFCPFKKLDKIIVINEEDSNYKQWDQNPRYNARIVAEQLAKNYQAHLILFSPSPRVETFKKTNDKIFRLIQEQPNSIKTQIIDLKNELLGGNFSLISNRLSEEIVKTKINKQKTLLYINRRGLASSVVCVDCGYIFNCPFCLLPLPLHSAGLLKCHFCGWQINLPSSCPNCHGTQFKTTGRGSEKVETEIVKIWPGCRVLRIDSDNLKNITSDQIEQADIYLGTELALKIVPWGKIGLISILSVDNLLYVPNFAAAHRLWSVLKKIEVAATQSQTKTIYLQTFSPDNEIYKNFYLKQNDAFYLNELKQRQELNYPPFSQLIKIIIQSPDQNVAKETAENVYQTLTTNQKTYNLKTLIAEPTPIYRNQIRGRYRYVIIIKNNSSNINLLLKQTPDDCLIDVDPEDLI